MPVPGEGREPWAVSSGRTPFCNRPRCLLRGIFSHVPRHATSGQATTLKRTGKVGCGRGGGRLEGAGAIGLRGHRPTDRWVPGRTCLRLSSLRGFCCCPLLSEPPGITAFPHRPKRPLHHTKTASPLSRYTLHASPTHPRPAPASALCIARLYSGVLSCASVELVVDRQPRSFSLVLVQSSPSFSGLNKKKTKKNSSLLVPNFLPLAPDVTLRRRLRSCVCSLLALTRVRPSTSLSELRHAPHPKLLLLKLSPLPPSIPASRNHVRVSGHAGWHF